MNWGSWAPALMALASANFTGGFFYGKVKDHGRRIDDLETKAETHVQHLQRVDIALVKLEQYNKGFADATKLAHKGMQS